MHIDRTDTALVFIDPQNDVLSEKGVSWAAGRRRASRRTTRSRIWSVSFRPRSSDGFEVFISPHYFFPTDQRLEVQRAARDG